MSKRATILAIIFLLILLVAIAFQWRNAQNQDQFVITMERGSCHGSCPTYTLTVYSDGTVYYYGDFNVRIYGEVITKIDHSQVELLLQEIRKSKIFNKNLGCCQRDVVDVAHVRFHIVLNGDTAVASYPASDEFDVPEELRHMECTIDEIVNSKQWLGRNFLCENVLD